MKPLYRAGEELLRFSQNLVEVWNASTPAANANGLGLTPEQAARYLDRFQTILRILPETPEIFPHGVGLCINIECRIWEIGRTATALPHHHRLDVDELADAVAGQLAPVARALDAAEGEARVRRGHGVDEHHAGF